MITGFKSKVSKEPFNLFWITAMILFVLSFFAWGQSIDIHLHDTYFVISTIIIIWILSFSFLLIWALYKCTSKILWKKFLTWFHVLTTILISIFFLTINFWYDKLVPNQEQTYVSFESVEAVDQKMATILLPLSILFIIGQMAFALNILVGLVKKTAKPK